MNLYLVSNNIADFYVLAKEYTEAKEKLEKLLDKADYGFSIDRNVHTIRLVAEEVKFFDNEKPIIGDCKKKTKLII